VRGTTSACLPHKGTKKCPLGAEQRDWNRSLAGQRVKVGHAIGGKKRYRAVADAYRNCLPKIDDRHNLPGAGPWIIRGAFVRRMRL
jgi:hypothetical protein